MKTIREAVAAGVPTRDMLKHLFPDGEVPTAMPTYTRRRDEALKRLLNGEPFALVAHESAIRRHLLALDLLRRRRDGQVAGDHPAVAEAAEIVRKRWIGTGLWGLIETSFDSIQARLKDESLADIARSFGIPAPRFAAVAEAWSCVHPDRALAVRPASRVRYGRLVRLANEGLTVDEIARKLGRSAPNVCTSLRRAIFDGLVPADSVAARGALTNMHRVNEAIRRSGGRIRLGQLREIIEVFPPQFLDRLLAEGERNGSDVSVTALMAGWLDRLFALHYEIVTGECGTDGVAPGAADGPDVSGERTDHVDHKRSDDPA